MDTYKEAIARISNAVRDKEAWPDDTSKLQEQLNLLFVATVAVGSDIPLGRLTLVTSSALSATSLRGTTRFFELPSNLFQMRADRGIHSFDMDGDIKFPHQQVQYSTVIMAGQNGFQNHQKLFSIDLDGNRVYANATTTLKLKHVPEFTKPTDQDYDTAGNFPLGEKDGQRAVHLVAYHVSGVTIRDSAAAQFHALLENEYNDQLQPQPEQ